MIWMLILTSFFQIITRGECSKLLLLQMLFRHGDRAPFATYPTNPIPVEVWPEGWGKLSMIGRKQHYDLGNYLRSMYSDFITTNPNEVMVNSSQADRCLRSAAANLASFYAPRPEYAFDESIPWQPIPIHYLPPDEDRFLYVHTALELCPGMQNDRENIFRSEEYQNWVKRHKDMLEHLSVYSGYNLFLETSLLSSLFDTLFVEKTHNLTIPNWAERYFQKLSEFVDLSNYLFFNSPTIKRLLAGPLIGDIVEKIQQKASGEDTPIKVRIFSAHDTNIAAVMANLGVFNRRKPPYCATLLFELHEMDDGQKAVRMLYINTTSPQYGVDAPHILKLEGCGEFCPLEVFVGQAMQGVPVDFERECWGEPDTALGAANQLSNLLSLQILLICVVFKWKILF